LLQRPHAARTSPFFFLFFPPPTPGLCPPKPIFCPGPKLPPSSTAFFPPSPSVFDPSHPCYMSPPPQFPCPRCFFFFVYCDSVGGRVLFRLFQSYSLSMFLTDPPSHPPPWRHPFSPPLALDISLPARFHFLFLFSVPFPPSFLNQSGHVFSRHSCLLHSAPSPRGHLLLLPSHGCLLFLTSLLFNPLPSVSPCSFFRVPPPPFFSFHKGHRGSFFSPLVCLCFLSRAGFRFFFSFFDF